MNWPVGSPRSLFSARRIVAHPWKAGGDKSVTLGIFWFVDFLAFWWGLMNRCFSFSGNRYFFFLDTPEDKLHTATTTGSVSFYTCATSMMTLVGAEGEELQWVCPLRVNFLLILKGTWDANLLPQESEALYRGSRCSSALLFLLYFNSDHRGASSWDRKCSVYTQTLAFFLRIPIIMVFFLWYGHTSIMNWLAPTNSFCTGHGTCIRWQRFLFMCNVKEI